MGGPLGRQVLLVPDTLNLRTRRVGTRPSTKSIYHLRKTFDLSSNAGGACVLQDPRSDETPWHDGRGSDFRAQDLEHTGQADRTILRIYRCLL